MPFYEFQCPEGTVTERLVPMGTAHIKCPKCNRRAKKILSACSFKLVGGGWYADGYSSAKTPRPKKRDPGFGLRRYKSGIRMRHPTAYVKAAQQTFAFQKNTSVPPVVLLQGGCYLLLINHQLRSFVCCHPNLNRQNHFLSFHYRSPGARVSQSQCKR
jgi:putative FmdB family regulatory protein